MIKLLITLIMLLGLEFQLQAQGVIQFSGVLNDNPSPTASNNGLVFLQNGGSPVLDTSTDINVELAYGTSIATVSSANAVATLLLTATQTVSDGSLGSVLSAEGDIQAFGDGQLWDNSGTDYTFNSHAYGNGLYFEVFAWTGDFSSYAAARASGTALTGTSGVFEENLGSTQYPGNIENMPALILTHSLAPVPEPSSLALMGLGGIALLGFRRLTHK